MTSDYSEFTAPLPQGKTETPGAKSHRFVILLHNHPVDHWDWMFENEGFLTTYRSSPSPFAGNPASPAVMTFLAPHRLEYLTYEGPVSGNRGNVQRVESGEFRWLEQQPCRWVLALAGSKIRGILTLQAIQTNGEMPIWEGTFKPSP